MVAGKNKTPKNQTEIFVGRPFLHIFCAHRLCINYVIAILLLVVAWANITTSCVGLTPQERQQKHGKSTLPGFLTISSFIYGAIKKSYLKNCLFFNMFLFRVLNTKLLQIWELLNVGCFASWDTYLHNQTRLNIFHPPSWWKVLN